MQPIGERLREARMRQGVDLTEVEVATKIRAKYLRAMENDEFSMLPGSTYVKSFLRTYAEYLGLDAQLLVEEFRAQHEPRGEGEVQSLAPPTRASPTRDRRGPVGGPPFGPGTLAILAVLLVLGILAVIGLASGGGGGGKKQAANPAGRAKKHKGGRAKAKRHAATPTAIPRTAKLKVIPADTTYICVDDGRGTKLFEGTISSSQTFRSKHLRINMGRSSATLYLNGKRVSYPRTSAAVGLAFSRTGRVTPLAPGDRPCA
jgi:transcriptional regulator with XRE-family HTH domain